MGPCCCSLHQRRGKQVQAMLTRCFLDDSCMACSTALSSSRPDDLSDPCGRVWQDFVASTLVVPHFPGSDTVSDSRTWQHCFDTLLACLLANFASPGTSITHETTVKPSVDVFQGTLQSGPAAPVGSQHSCQPTVKLHILPLVWNFPLGKG